MRKITREALQAFTNGYGMKKANMEVNDNGMYLHGNLIAKFENGKLMISNCGWWSNTTKERLNAILSYYSYGRIYQQDWVWYYTDSKGNTDIFHENSNFIEAC